MKRVFITLYLAAFLQPVLFAQQNFSAAEINEKPSSVSVGKFWNNWFISAGGGVNLYIGDRNQDIGSHLSPAVDFSFGKWITPAFGVRLQYNGISMDATGEPSYWYTSNNPGFEHVKFGYHAIHTDFLLNLTTAIGGYNPERKYQLIPFFGWGWSMSQSKVYTNRKRNELFAIAGLKNNFRISNSFDIHLELSATAVSSRLAGAMLGGSANFPLAATAGFTYHFGGKNARRWKTCSASNKADISLFRNQINTLTETNAKLQAENDALKNQPVVAAVEPLQPKVEKVIEKVIIPVPVFFDFNKCNVTPREVASLKYIADYIKENSGAKFVVKGYADSQTGSKTANQRLSDKRAEAIKEVLVKKYGINASQLQIVGEGGVEDLFDSSYLNRAAIVLSK